MSKSNLPRSEFVICVREPDLRNRKHVLIHPVLLIKNDDPNETVSPESVIHSFKLMGSPQSGELISISKSQVSERNWKLLIEGLKNSEVYKTGVKVKEELLCV